MDSFYALAEPRRRKIVEILAGAGSLTATQICDNFKVTPQAISQHLKILLESKILFVDKHAQQRIYRVNPNSMAEIEQWTRKMTTTWNERFDRLDSLLESEKKSNTKTR